MGRSLLNRAKISEFSKGIYDNCRITNIDIKDRKGKNGPINKMIYIKFAQLNEAGKRLSESELAWWKPDPTSDYFKVNLQEMCLQLHNIVSCYMSEDEAFEVFKDVFNDLDIEKHEDIENKKWKLSEVSTLNIALKDAFVAAMTPFLNSEEFPIRVKLTTNYKGEDIEIPKYGLFMEPMSKEKTSLKFTANELKTHSKAGNVKVGTSTAVSSTNSTATI